MSERIKSSDAAILGNSTTSSAKSIEQTQWRKYHTRCGHGFAAEDANALHDRLCGRDVEMTGLTNEANGADRVVNGVSIQTKYCASAYESVNAAFDQNGVYRYSGQRLEVPKDQYEQALGYMADKIRDGKVPGVTDPSDASRLVKRGHVTYQEASNIGRAGNIDSIMFDAKTGAVTCSMAAGISFAIRYYSDRKAGCSVGDAVKASATDAAVTGGKVLGTHIATQQFLRTQVGREAAAVATKAAKRMIDSACSTQVGEKIVTRTVAGMTGAGKGMAANAARVAGTKLLRTNMVTAAVCTVVTTVPDVVQACRGKMTWKEVGINSASNTAGIGGGAAGAWIGAAIGSVIPGPGTAIGGFIGGMIGGIAASSGTRKLFNRKAKA